MGKLFEGKYRMLFVVLLFLPLLFIDNRASHDWGDDFAQYIHQAGNFVHGIPQSQTGFVYSQENYIGPAAYPSGFPLLLAPVYAIFGNSIKAFTIYISIFYFLLALLCFRFFKDRFSEFTALVLAFILIYNPQLLVFKQEVMSDLPFTAFLLLAILIYRGLDFKKPGSLVLFGLLLGFIAMIRSVGFVLIVAVFAHQAIQIYKTRKEGPGIKKWIPAVIMTVSSILFYFLVNSLIFRIPSGGSLRDYLVFYYSGDFLTTIPKNLEQYIEVFRFIYTPEAGFLKFACLVTGSVFLVMTITGFIRKVSSSLDLFDLFVIFYLLILLLFPNNYSAFRLLIPTLAFLLYYTAIGFSWLKLPWLSKGKTAAIVLGSFMLVLFAPGIVKVAQSQHTLLDGPQERTAMQAFRYMEKNLPDSASIVFFKPRALALYAGRQGIVDPFSTDPTSIHLQLMGSGADYILIHKNHTNESMKRYVRLLKERAVKVWYNRDYALYKVDLFSR